MEGDYWSAGQSRATQSRAEYIESKEQYLYEPTNEDIAGEASNSQIGIAKVSAQDIKEEREEMELAESKNNTLTLTCR